MRRHGVFDVGLHFLNFGIDVAVGDKNIGPAVEVVVKEEATEAERQQRGATDGGLRGLVNKQALAFIVVEGKHLIGKVGDHHAGITGMIVIGSVHAHAGACHTVFAKGDSSDHTFFGKGAVAVVAVELVGLRVVGEEQIGPAVVVVVDNCKDQRLGR